MGMDAAQTGSMKNRGMFSFSKHGKQFCKSLRVEPVKNTVVRQKTYKCSYSPNATPIKTIIERKMLFFLRNRSR